MTTTSKARSPAPKPSTRYHTIVTGPYAGQPRRPQLDRRQTLTRKQIRELINASAFAEECNMPLDVMLTVVWRHTPHFDGTDRAWAALQTKLFDRMQRFLRSRGIKVAFVWVRERRRGHGAHTHVALHLGPGPYRIERDVETYLTRTFDFAPGGVDIRGAEDGPLTKDSRIGIIQYVIKGMDPLDFRYTGEGVNTEKIADILQIENRGSQGRITIKRAGVSQNLAIAARKRAGQPEHKDLTAQARVLGVPKKPRKRLWRETSVVTPPKPKQTSARRIRGNPVKAGRRSRAPKKTKRSKPTPTPPRA